MFITTLNYTDELAITSRRMKLFLLTWACAPYIVAASRPIAVLGAGCWVLLIPMLKIVDKYAVEK